MTARARTALDAALGVGRARLGTALALVSLAAGSVLAASLTDDVPDATAQVSGGERPNVVVVQTDDMVMGDLRAMPKTRRLIQREGTRFNRYFATHPRCCPSRASYLTGQYSHNHGVQSNNAGTGGGYYNLDHSETLPVWLSRQGYTTGHIGKYMNGYGARDRTEIPPGWDRWHGVVAGEATKMYGYTLSENGEVVYYGGDESDYQADVFADKAVDFIEESSVLSRPFFLSVNPTAPHVENKRTAGPDIPRNPRPAPRHFGSFGGVGMPKPPSYDEKDVSDKPSFVRMRRRLNRTQKQRIQKRYVSRLESLLAVDDAVGRIVKALEDGGELDDTAIVFVSDNGYFQGEHRIPGQKAQLYEEAVRVPLLIRGPGFPAGVTRRQLVGNVDLAPTILSLTGAESRGHAIDGTSLLPLARDPSRGRARDLLLDTGVGGATGVRTSRYSYIEHETGERELYDLGKDPYQLHSLHRSRPHREIREGFEEYLGWLRRCSGDVCRVGPPELELHLAYETGGTAEARCVDSRVRARVIGRDRRRVEQVVFGLDGDRIARDRSAPFKVRVGKKRLSRKRSSTLEARATLRDGRRRTLEESVPERCR